MHRIIILILFLLAFMVACAPEPEKISIEDIDLPPTTVAEEFVCSEMEEWTYIDGVIIGVWTLQGNDVWIPGSFIIDEENYIHVSNCRSRARVAYIQFEDIEEEE